MSYARLKAWKDRRKAEQQLQKALASAQNTPIPKVLDPRTERIVSAWWTLLPTPGLSRQPPPKPKPEPEPEPVDPNAPVIVSERLITVPRE